MQRLNADASAVTDLVRGTVVADSFEDLLAAD